MTNDLFWKYWKVPPLLPPPTVIIALRTQWKKLNFKAISAGYSGMVTPCQLRKVVISDVKGVKLVCMFITGDGLRM